MIEKKYFLNFKMTITFDDIFDYNGFSEEFHSIEEAVDRAEFFIQSYDFNKAVITNSITGEILATLIWQTKYNRQN